MISKIIFARIVASWFRENIKAPLPVMGSGALIFEIEDEVGGGRCQLPHPTLP
ncbi:hypothetical protein [Kineosporia mesophila]|uniref:hypothetical protein n=1 Tax=Kineosporia mesophila TaxID=566012 RepID=UPI001E46884F|nr:hypothetical protein [Kineosporia mesophila]MCD5350818.1 hypothetical protein [Kineosporia mesophila]